MTTCDGQYEPKPTAPPNWVITPENLYNGKLLDVFAGVYAAKELASQTQPGTQNQEYSTRKNQWIDFLNKIKLPPQQNTHIIDLGLTPDLCHQGRPPEPGIPSLTPEGLINGSVGNAVAELLKQQLFDQWCECKSRDRPGETCPCQLYDLLFTYERKGVSPTGVLNGNVVVIGKVSSLQQNPGNNGYTQYGVQTEIDCPTQFHGPEGQFELLLGVPDNEAKDWEVIIKSITIRPGSPVIDCHPAPAPPPPPAYVPGLPPGYDIGLPPDLPNTTPDTWKAPGWFAPITSPFGTPTFPPPPLNCDYMYWDFKNDGAVEFYSGIPPTQGVVVFGTAVTAAFDISFDAASAIADKTLRSWRKRTQPITDDTTFINAAQVYLMIDGVVIDDGVQMNVPKIRITVPFEYRDRQKSIKIMPKGIETTFTVSDSGNRWISKKFPTS